MATIKKTPFTELPRVRRKEEETVAQQKAQKFGIPYLNLDVFPLNVSALALIPEEKAREGKVAVARQEGRTLILAALNPSSPQVQEIIKELGERHFIVQQAAASYSSLLHAWDKYKFYKKTAEELRKIFVIPYSRVRQLKNLLKTRQDVEQSLAAISEEDAAAFLEMLFIGAAEANSNDIHIEPEENAIKVRFRIDGILHDIASIPKSLYEHSLNRLKILAELNLNTPQAAQDGRFTIRQQGENSENNSDIDVRISLIPSYFGETVVMRLLGVAVSLLDIETLGMEKRQKEMLLSVLGLPNGMLLTTGPTGSGKTTLLYAALNKVKKPEVNIITVEDPIEYKIEGITQTQVNKEEGYTFEKGLQAILRQDPDVVLVGEIRSEETALTAINASLTGHLVLSTLHTNDATGAIQRLKNLKVPSSVIPSSLRLIIAQRLVRKLCSSCKRQIPFPQEKYQAVKDTLAAISPKSRITPPPLPSALYTLGGCTTCFTTGYAGRTGVFELFEITPAMGEKILANANPYEIRKAAIEEGMLTLTQHALLKTLDGETSLEEVERVVGDIS